VDEIALIRDTVSHYTPVLIAPFVAPVSVAGPEFFLLARVVHTVFFPRAAEVVRTTKQYLLHHGYEGRLSTAGNLAFPFTPPEVSVGPAYRFNVYHLMRASDLDALFPLEIETV